MVARKNRNVKAGLIIRSNAQNATGCGYEGLVSRDRRVIREKIETESKIRNWFQGSRNGEYRSQDLGDPRLSVQVSTFREVSKRGNETGRSKLNWSWQLGFT
jgi:hypothetical protein